MGVRRVGWFALLIFVNLSAVAFANHHARNSREGSEHKKQHLEP